MQHRIGLDEVLVILNRHRPEIVGDEAVEERIPDFFDPVADPQAGSKSEHEGDLVERGLVSREVLRGNARNEQLEAGRRRPAIDVFQRLDSRAYIGDCFQIVDTWDASPKQGGFPLHGAQRESDSSELRSHGLWASHTRAETMAGLEDW